MIDIVKWRQYEKTVRYIPIIAAIALIFVLTTQTGRETVALSRSFNGWLVDICNKIGVVTDNEWWNTDKGVRLLGHVIECFALGLAAGIAFRKKWLALIFCMGVSIADQITKIFVPIRHFDAGDIPFDIIGFVSGILIIWVIEIAVKALKE